MDNQKRDDFVRQAQDILDGLHFEPVPPSIPHKHAFSNGVGRIELFESETGNCLVLIGAEGSEQMSDVWWILRIDDRATHDRLRAIHDKHPTSLEVSVQILREYCLPLLTGEKSFVPYHERWNTEFGHLR